jgi:DNA-binding MarR family transcriptional regulator
MANIGFLSSSSFFNDAYASWHDSLFSAFDHEMYNCDVYTSLPKDETQCACTTVKKLSRVLGRVYDRGVAPAGLNITQQAVLRCIARRTGEPLVRVAEELEMDRTSLYRALNPMIRDGWITTMDGKGSRYRTAKLTRAGRLVLSDANARWTELQDDVISRFGKKSYERLLGELHRLAECAEAEAQLG